MFDFFALLIAVVALIVARKTFNQIAVLRARLDGLEAAAMRATPATAPPPLVPHLEADQALPAAVAPVKHRGRTTTAAARN